MRVRLLITVLTALLVACRAPEPGPARSVYFADAAFAGLISPAEQGAAARLDFELDGTDGELMHIRNCAQASNTSDEQVVPSQLILLRQLRANCAAFNRFSTAHSATRSALPDGLSIDFVRQLPVTILPEPYDAVAGTAVAPPIVAARDVVRVEVASAGRIHVITATDDVFVTRMAQGDFDADGSEDMLLRVDWKVRDAIVRGVALVQVSRTSPADPPRIAWRWGGGA